MTDIQDLLHAIRPLPGGGEVLVLDTGARIGAEAQAMLAAMYSRSASGARALLERLRTRGPDAFLRQNYQVGYGHKSIGDLGEAAIFVDGVSMLCAKAIQDFPLYRGQESSTRYIDFSNQRFVNPAGSEVGTEILEGWRTFYLEAFDAMIPHLTAQFPRGEGEDEKLYEKAIKARAFDVVRAFLPAGATTNVAWVGDLRHVNDHLLTLRNHPLGEVRSVALAIEAACAERFPSSFDPGKRYEASEAYTRAVGAAYGYFDPPRGPWPHFRIEHDGVVIQRLIDYRHALSKRPPKTELPFAIRECGAMTFDFKLDFGSYRDLQRHRAVTLPMPLLTDRFDFEPWYTNQLPFELGCNAGQLLGLQSDRLGRIGVSNFERQYYLPMGMRLPIRLTGDLRALVYLAELRSTRFVHPTLQRRAIEVAKTLRERFGRFGLVLHLDLEPDRFDVRRGGHDIVEK